MNQLNSIILEGNLADCVVSKTSFSVAKMTVLYNHLFKKTDGTETLESSSFDVVAYGNIASFCEKYAVKDRGVRIVGRLKQSVWTDDNGSSHSKVLIIAEHIEFKPLVKSV